MDRMALRMSYDYDSFSIDKANRPISERHVERLAGLVDQTYMLDLYPIVVDSNGINADGQHRIAMAKSMNLPFYYIVSDEVSIQDIANCNGATHRYNNDDSLHVYSQLGVESYEKVKALKDMCPIGTGALAEWASSNYKHGEFATGDYVMNRESYAWRAVEALMDIAAYNNRILSSKAYKTAVSNLILNPLYDHKRMMEQLGKLPTRLVPCGTVDEALEIITSIYNYNRLERNRVTFVYNKALAAPIDQPIVHSITRPSRDVVRCNAIEIYKIGDLSRFSIHPAARPLHSIDKLVRSVQQKNLLHCFPIIVDENMVVYDGQIRLAVARKLGLPIYYIVAKNIDMWMIAQAGGASKSWSLRDHLDYHVAMGNPTYIRIQQLLRDHKYIYTDMLIGLSRNGLYEARNMFKIGRIDVDWHLVDRLVVMLGKLNGDKLRRTFGVQAALSYIVKRFTDRYTLDRVIQVINRDADEFFGIVDRSEYLKRIESLYNRGIDPHRHIRLSKV